MRLLILKDKLIPDGKLKKVEEELAYFYRHYAGDNLTFKQEERDFTNLPVQDYGGGDLGISKKFINEQAKDIKQRYADEIDLVMFLVYEDNWKPIADTRIWGWNISYPVYGYEIEQCRWDKKNEANTFGTMYHEIAHSHDTFIYRNAGKRIDKILGLSRWGWDEGVVHGKNEKYKYIRYKENTDALEAIGGYLKEASINRLVQYRRRVMLLQKKILLLKKIVELYRNLIIKVSPKKDRPIYEGNVCL